MQLGSAFKTIAGNAYNNFLVETYNTILTQRISKDKGVHRGQIFNTTMQSEVDYFLTTE